MSMLNLMFYNVADRIINPDNTDNMKETLSNLVRGSLGFGKDVTPDDDYADDGSLIGDGSDVLSEIRDNDATYNDNLMSLFPTEFDEFSEANAEANGSLLDGMRMSTFKVELINAELDIVDPMQLAFREMFLGLREDNLMFQHENSVWFERIVEGLNNVDRTTRESGIGIALAYRQFMRHPVWYSMMGAANLLLGVGKVGFGLLFGFEKKKSTEEKILEETKKQTEFMLTGQIDDTKSTWEQFKSGGVVGLIGRSIGENLGITQSEAQKRADARLQGEEVAGGITGFLSDKLFGKEIIRRGQIEQQKEEPSECCLNTNKLLKQMKRVSEKEHEEAIEFLESIGDNTKDTAKESKKTNRHLLMSKMMNILSSVGSFFKGFGGVGGLLKKGLGASMIYFALKSGMDKLKSGDGMGIGNMIGTTVGGLLVGGVKGALLGGSFSVGTVIGTWANDNLINPAVEWLSGKEGQTLGTAVYDFFNGMKDKMMMMTREDLDVEKKKREEANFVQKKLGIGVMTESEIAEVEERLRGEERMLAGARRKKEAREAAENSSYKNVGEVDAVLADVDAKIAGLAQAIPALSAQGQHQIAARYSQELGALEAQKSELTKVKSGLELMGGSKEKSFTEQAKDVAVKSGAAVASGAQSLANYVYDASVGAWKNIKDGAYYIKDKVTGMFKKAPDQTGFTSYNGGPISSGRPESIKDVLETGSSVSSGYSDFQRSQDEREVQEAIARQQQNVEYTKNREQIGQMRTGGFAAAQADYNRKMGISNNPTIVQPSTPTINTAEARKDANARFAETANAVMEKKMDRMIDSIDKQTKALDAAMGQIPMFDPYPDNKTILNASGGTF